MFVGTSLNPPSHFSTLESLIPNSQVVINPPAPAAVEEGTAPQPVKTRSQEWRSELFLHPGDCIPWVGAAVVGTVLVLGMVVAGLHEQEKVNRSCGSGVCQRLTHTSEKTRRSEEEHCTRSTFTHYNGCFIWRGLSEIRWIISTCTIVFSTAVYDARTARSGYRTLQKTDAGAFKSDPFAGPESYAY